jgi:hypothetical protein
MYTLFLSYYEQRKILWLCILAWSKSFPWEATAKNTFYKIGSVGSFWIQEEPGGLSGKMCGAGFGAGFGAKFGSSSMDFACLLAWWAL